MTKAIAITIVLLLAALGWQWSRATAARAAEDRVGREFSEYREAQERQHAQALETLRADKNRADKIRQEALDAEHLARQAAQADADRLRATTGQLQRLAADLSTSLGRAAGDPATACSCQAAAERISRLAVVVGALDDLAAGAVSAAGDARTRGQLCEHYYSGALIGSPASR